MSNRFWVPGIPVAKARPRVTMIGGRARAYTPKKSADWEREIQKHVRMQPLQGPLIMTIVCHLPIPKSWSKKKHAQAVSGSVFPVSKPDVDNYAKSVMDALNGIAYFDDSQVVTLTCQKQYSADEPGLMIEIIPSLPN